MPRILFGDRFLQKNKRLHKSLCETFVPFAVSLAAYFCFTASIVKLIVTSLPTIAVPFFIAA
jgi:hypothetical protein